MPLVDPWLPKPDPQTGRISPEPATIRQRVYRVPRDVAKHWQWQAAVLLDNVDVAFVEQELGPDPGRARVRYVLGNGDPAAPQTWEECLSDAVTKAKTIRADDRIVITATRPDGVEEPYFDGKARGFRGAVDGDREHVAVDLTGIAVELWDNPVQTVMWRSGPDPTDPATDVAIEAAGHFNPRGARNCIPDGTGDETLYWHDPGGQADHKYPVFIDEDNARLLAIDDKLKTIAWDYARAARYLLFKENADEEYVTNPDGAEIDDVLVARIPKGLDFDPLLESTFDRQEIPVADKPIGGKGMPDALAEIIAGKGFEIRLETGPAQGGYAIQPETTLEILLPQAQVANPLWLQPRGSTLDLALSEINAFHVGRDLNQVANEWLVEGELEEWECAILLDAGYPTVVGDQSIGYDRSLANFDTVRDKYRLLVADESGEGHYHFASAAKLTTALNLDSVLGAPDMVGGKAVPRYAHRRRPPLQDLVYQPDPKRPVKARLDVALATDCTLTPPLVWGSNLTGKGATWQPIPHGWELLKDRLGVWINVKNPNAWHVGTGSVIPSGVIKMVEMSQFATGNPKLVFRLTVAFRGDLRCSGLATRQLGTVIRSNVRRVVDAHDRYKMRMIAPYSPNNTSKDPIAARDDSDLALAEATATQLVTQAGALVGEPVAIPRFTLFHRLGSRVSQIQGRGLTFKTNNSDTAAPTYPVVIRRRLEFGPDSQRTILTFSDADAGRHSYMGAIGKARRQGAR